MTAPIHLPGRKNTMPEEPQEKSESLWDAMERLRLSTISGMDRLEAGIAEIKERHDA